MRFKTIIIDINETNVFFTSDTHFQHKNIIKYCNRPFNTVREMDSALVKNWNAVVGPDDIVFHGGDFCFGAKSSWAYLCDALNGKKYLAGGNHDGNITPDKFVDVQQMFNIRIMGDEEIASDGQRITLCHYPMLSWYQSHRGAWQLFGHVHGGLSNKGEMKTTPNQLDVGVDVHNFTPISYETVKEIITKQNLRNV
jgi:calcineurin-like phosphoesterase family protein